MVSFLNGNVEVLATYRIVGKLLNSDRFQQPQPYPPAIEILDSRTRPDTQYWAGNLQITFNFGLGPAQERGSFSVVRILNY